MYSKESNLFESPTISREVPEAPRTFEIKSRHSRYFVPDWYRDDTFWPI